MASSDSDSAGRHKSTKSSKKSKNRSERKHKKNKKEKQHKHRKHSKNDIDSVQDRDVTRNKTPKLLTSSIATHIIVDSFGPALPPHLLKLQSVSTAAIGPVLPNSFNAEYSDLHKPTIKEPQVLDKIEDSSADFFGPMPVADDIPMSVVERELEQRALELKLAAFDGNDGTKVSDQKVREEWMLELPDVGLKGGLAALSNLKRTFHQGKEKPDFSDR